VSKLFASGERDRSEVRANLLNLTPQTDRHLTLVLNYVICGVLYHLKKYEL